MAADKVSNAKEKEIVLVGASIGKAWQIEQLGKRESLPGYSFGYVGVNAFDKSPLVEQIIARKQKPDFVMLKECSTYFPGNTEQYHRGVENWVAQLKRAGIRPVLVTTAPVAEPAGVIAKGKIALKHLFGMHAWMDEISAYNAWLREYAAREQLPLFDLEAVLRISDTNKYLKKEYDIGDMVHLTPAAYKAMDHEFAAFLRRLDASVVYLH
ncbi:MAG: hypothetical protein HY081_09460 [Gammaproteobacteria bacterium]|nr:hypothetical protein [Gammaproteobacteria bacterium]